MVMKTSAQSEALTIPAGEFKAKCLKLMDEAVLTQKSFTITKRGKVVGEFVPAQPDAKPFRSLFGRTPGVSLPTQAEWTKLKNEWADEWDKSTERLARQINGDFSEDR
jgi:antitoxin (DNA-binding transcriptional repressor) of toxin-antitoxin stability system